MIKNIKLLVMDVDGTLTDGKLYISEHREEFKAFNVKDGYGIHTILPQKHVIPIIITGRESAILKLRCRELNILHLYQDVKDKFATLQGLLKQLSLSFENVAYIGDDDNDLEAMCAVAVVGCPADSSEAVIKKADFISNKNGGSGAVRDFIEWMTKYGHI